MPREIRKSTRALRVYFHVKKARKLLDNKPHAECLESALKRIKRCSTVVLRNNQDLNTLLQLWALRPNGTRKWDGEVLVYPRNHELLQRVQVSGLRLHRITAAALGLPQW